MNIVGFDNTLLSILLNPRCGVPLDPGTNQPVARAQDRAKFLVARLSKARARVVIPCPAIAELLTDIGPSAQEYYSIIARYRVFEIAAFDHICAIELALLNREVFKPHDPKTPAESYQKVKIDRQIISIFKVAGVNNVYTDDTGMSNRARLCGLTPVATAHLPLPEDERQSSLDLEPHHETPEPIDVSED